MASYRKSRELLTVLLKKSTPKIMRCENGSMEQQKKQVSIKCQANVMVLRPIDLDETCVLIVEKSADTDLWHDVEDDTVRSEILQKYMENNRPDCMEVVE